MKKAIITLAVLNVLLGGIRLAVAATNYPSKPETACPSGNCHHQEPKVPDNACGSPC